MRQCINASIIVSTPCANLTQSATVATTLTGGYVEKLGSKV